MPLNYTDGAEVVTSIAVALSADGKVVHDALTNTLVITDTPDNLDSVISLLNALDQRTREVQIDMRFVEYSTTDAERIGFTELGLNVDVDGIGNWATSFFPFSDTGLTTDLTRTNAGPTGTVHNSYSNNF